MPTTRKEPAEIYANPKLVFQRKNASGVTRYDTRKLESEGTHSLFVREGRGATDFFGVIAPKITFIMPNNYMRIPTYEASELVLTDILILLPMLIDYICGIVSLTPISPNLSV